MPSKNWPLEILLFLYKFSVEVRFSSRTERLYALIVSGNEKDITNGFLFTTWIKHVDMIELSCLETAFTLTSPMAEAIMPPVALNEIVPGELMPVLSMENVTSSSSPTVCSSAVLFGCL